jgi:hypothetical protein
MGNEEVKTDPNTHQSNPLAVKKRNGAKTVSSSQNSVHTDNSRILP